MRDRICVVAAVVALAALVVQAQQTPGRNAVRAFRETGSQAPAGAQGAPPAEGRGAGAGRGRQAGPPPRILTFEARPSSLKPGESAQLVWHTENPAAPAIEPGVGRVLPIGTTRVTPVATTTYILTNGAVTRSVTVVVAGTKPAAAAPGLPPAAAASKGIARTPEGKPDFSGVYAFGGGGGRGAGAGRGAAPAGPTLKPGAEK